MFTINDYSVIIGKDNCIITELRVDRLTCTPPVQQPEIGEEYYIYNEYPIPQVEVRKNQGDVMQIVIYFCQRFQPLFFINIRLYAPMLRNNQVKCLAIYF